MRDSSGESATRTFLHRPFNFLVTLAVIGTTVFSQYQENSWCIILFVLCRMVDGGPVKAIRAAFRNPFFLAILALVVLDTIGLLFTHNRDAGSRLVEKEATLVAIALVLCGGKFADGGDYRRLMTGFCVILLAACFYCFTMAWNHYHRMPDKDISVFFYHSLTRYIGQNAVFFTVYMIFGLLYLLYHPLATGPFPRWLRQSLQVLMVILFVVFILLLSSKLLLVVTALLLANFILQRYIRLQRYVNIALMGLLGMMLCLWLVVSDNPIRDRYLDLERGEISIVRQSTFDNNTMFNGASIRLLQWKYANEILREHHAWVFGVTGGDSQDLLNDKYRQAKLFMGVPHTRQRGFTDYNFHNQYIETTVRSGLLGLAIFLYCCWLMIVLAERRRTAEAAFTVLTLLSICTTQSFLTLQHGVFAFAFMPLILLYSPRGRQ
ncbi:MAG TPA: O-antigen ligase family protein [Puia sp.]|uniref:O-antigen ligase family protein n=1 Tax=Puia sp. TaxID=2045100 RepID=UPI002CA781E7|nr:O-antigen ligase family protein [Puia sp.]HVU99198.1 O-antigen ligase family protein [Puia sp.]